MITMKELQDKIGGVFYFATVENGVVKGLELGEADITLEVDGVKAVCHGTHKAAYAQLMKDPHLEVCAFKDGSFVRIRGKAVMDDRDEVQKAMYESAPFLEKTYNAQTGHHHICFYLEDMSAMEFKGPEAIRLV